MFALTRNLAKGRDVTEIVAPLETVQRHLLAPLAARAGISLCKGDLVRATVAWANLVHDVPPIIERFRAIGARVIPIKGLAYAAGLYSAPAERPMTDVDLLIEQQYEASAQTVLADLGFERFPGPALHHASTWVRSGLVVDLHRNILGDGRSEIDLSAVWSRTLKGWPDGAERLDPIDELVFHLIHMARNRLCGALVNVIDATRLATRCPVDRALARATDWGVGHAARTAWSFVETIVEDRPSSWLEPSPSDVVAMRQPSAARKVIFDMATAGSVRHLARRSYALGVDRLRRFS